MALRIRLLSRISEGFSHSVREKALVQAHRQAEVGRRLSIYDRETGFLAPWYLLLRAREELIRSKRYQHYISLFVVDAPGEQALRLNGWLSAGLRTTDLVCRDGGGLYYLILPETSPEGAHTVVKRLLADIEVVRVSVAVFPDDEARFRELLAPLEARWRIGAVQAVA
jgi:GGDEF domain-containing protein